MTLLISPETKVGALLEAYPGIEDTLIAWVPAFSKLKNPILRKTVAKVATLEQAAQIAGVNVRDLVRKLREATGQAPVNGAELHVLAAADDPRPAWVREDAIRFDIDADAMLQTGEHPIGRVRQSAAALKPGEIVRLTSSFRPVPLIDTMRRGGLAVYCAEVAAGRHATYIALATENQPGSAPE